ncbi:hypothetical protein [Methanothrix soehngenii]|uniref:hypothetical protein n=1 Tax=Methanothrix soehngenii TaxID=2223 RepID=UPI00300D5AA0
MSESQNPDANSKSLGTFTGMVLVIDDEPILVDLTRKFLEMTGIQSIGFTAAEEAVEWVSAALCLR